MTYYIQINIVLALICSAFSPCSANNILCKVKPTEYSYRDDSVNRADSFSANCRRYSDSGGTIPFPQDYIHCDGTQLKLADSNLGQEESRTSDYYWWAAGSYEQLLFIFPTRVSLTTITLPYFTDSHHGLPRLRFYPVPDDFDIWNLNPSTSYPYIDVATAPPSGESVGRRSISISVNFNTTKVLMYKYSTNFVFAVSEVEFFTCNFTSTAITADTSTSSIRAESDDHHIRVTTFPKNLTTMKNFDKTNSLAKTTSKTPGSMTNEKMMTVQPNSVTGVIAIGVSIAILLILSTILIIVVVLIWCYKRRSTKQNLIYTDSPYSTFSRETGQQIQPQSLQNNSAELYDQLHLSPSTGQTEFISKSETANINKSSLMPWNSHPTYSTAGDDKAEHSSALNAANQVIISHKIHEITCEQPTYAAIDKSKKKKIKKQSKKEDPECKVAEKSPPVSPYRNDSEVPSASMQEKKKKAEQQTINPPNTVEELYTAVKKKPKGSQPKDEEETPPIPPHTVEELYTAVEKKPKTIPDENKEEAPTQTVLQTMTEDLYTAAMKVLKDGSTEVAPPIPPHTVEELYTAVMKKPKESTENEEEAPPIPPYTVEGN